MKKTLVIHPKDASTYMLKYVYEGKDFDVLTDFINDNDADKLKEIIKQYDRIIMLGHGTPYGLLNSGMMGYVIDGSFADILKEKETISLWCNSDKFFSKYNMHGFHSGMIISEVSEAEFVLGYSPMNKEEIYENDTNLAKFLNECIDMEPEEMKNYILERYNYDDDITRFNRKNIIIL